MESYLGCASLSLLLEQMKSMKQRHLMEPSPRFSLFLTEISSGKPPWQPREPFCKRSPIIQISKHAKNSQNQKHVFRFCVQLHRARGVRDTWPPSLPGRSRPSHTGSTPHRLGERGEGEDETSGEGDAAYCYTLLEHALPILDQFKPNLIIVACGLDAMAGDP